MILKRTLLLVIAAAIVLSGCQTMSEREQSGTVFGALGGAVVGYLAGDEKGALIGAAVGSLAGNRIGAYMDQQEAEVRTLVSENEVLSDTVEVSRRSENQIVMEVPGHITFWTNSAELRPEFKEALDEMAQVLLEYKHTDVQIIGHTDSRGPAEYNMQLSERRASAVGNYLADRVGSNRIFTEGRGETELIALGNSPEDHARNRRVEMVLYVEQTE